MHTVLYCRLLCLLDISLLLSHCAVPGCAVLGFVEFVALAQRASRGAYGKSQASSPATRIRRAAHAQHDDDARYQIGSSSGSCTHTHNIGTRRSQSFICIFEEPIIVASRPQAELWLSSSGRVHLREPVGFANRMIGSGVYLFAMHEVCRRTSQRLESVSVAPFAAGMRLWVVVVSSEKGRGESAVQR